MWDETSHQNDSYFFVSLPVCFTIQVSGYCSSDKSCTYFEVFVLFSFFCFVLLPLECLTLLLLFSYQNHIHPSSHVCNPYTHLSFPEIFKIFLHSTLYFIVFIYWFIMCLPAGLKAQWKKEFCLIHHFIFLVWYSALCLDACKCFWMSKSL